MTGTKGVETFTTGFLFLKMFNNACGVVCVSDLKIKTIFLAPFVYGNVNFCSTLDVVISITDGANPGTGDAGATATNDR